MDTRPPEGSIAVIFTNTRTEADDEGYAVMAARMVDLATQQDGYLGMSSVRDPKTRVGITVSYWRDEAAARAWKSVAEHLHAQQLGRERWYASYETVVASVTRSYRFGDEATQ